MTNVLHTAKDRGLSSHVPLIAFKLRIVADAVFVLPSTGSLLLLLLLMFAIVLSYLTTSPIPSRHAATPQSPTYWFYPFT